MKKVFAISFMFLLVISFSVTAYATTEMSFFGGEMEIKAPEGYYVIYKDMSEDDPVLETIGITKSEAEEVLDGAEIDFVSEDYSIDIYIYCEECNYYNFDEYSEEEIREYIKELENLFEESDVPINLIEEASFGEAKYIKVETGKMDGDYSYLDYNTVHRGLDLSVTLYSWEGEITEEHRKIAESVVESIVFKNERVDYYSEEPFEVVVDEIGTKLVLPQGWTVLESYPGAIYAYGKNGVGLLYSYYDVWKNYITDEDRSYLARSKANLSTYSEEEIKEIFLSDEVINTYKEQGISIDENTFKKIKCGNYDCVMFGTKSDSADLLFKNVELYFYLENGISHYYMFSGAKEENNEEIKEIIASAEYPDIPDEGGEKAESGEKSEGAVAAKVVLKALRYGIIGSVFAGLVSLIKNAVKEIQNKKHPKEEEKPLVTEEKEERGKFCSECGAQLDEKDKFCPLCGTKVK